MAPVTIRCVVCDGELVVDTKQMQVKCSQCGLLYQLESLRKMAEGIREEQDHPAQLDAPKVTKQLGEIQESTHREYAQEVPKALSVPASAKPSASANVASADTAGATDVGDSSLLLQKTPPQPTNYQYQQDTQPQAVQVPLPQQSAQAATLSVQLQTPARVTDMNAQPPAIENSDSGVKVTPLPVIEKWKTSAPLSVFGLLVYAAIYMTVGILFSNQLWAVVCTVAVLPLVFAIYAIAFYPSFMSSKPILKSPNVISFCNFFVGGPIFGPIWNFKLTKNKAENYQPPRRGISHIVHASCSLVVALMGIALIFLAMMMPILPSGLKVGDTVNYGTYKGEPLKWQVLDFDGNKALLVTANIISVKAHGGDGTWAKSRIREWLEGDFRQSFNYIENAHILNWYHYDTMTTDTVFLLNLVEAKNYFPEDKARCARAMNFSDAEIAELARYNVEYRIKLDGKELSYSEWVDRLEQWYQYGLNTPWYLRTHGENPGTFSVVAFDGNILPEGGAEAPYGIRPAMWVTR